MTEKGTDKDITGTTRRVYQFISDFIDTNGYSPSVREIGRGVGLKSTSSVAAHIVKLQDSGYIRKTSECPRTITLQGGVTQ